MQTTKQPTRILVADCPWRFRDKYGKRGADAHYVGEKTIPTFGLMRFPLPEMADDAVLFLWRVSAMQQDALDVIRAWGFELKTEIVWRKLTVNGHPATGTGHITRGSHETCLIARRGKPVEVEDHALRSVLETFGENVFDAKLDEHSRKPDEFFKIVESLYPIKPGEVGSHVELFAREQRTGWLCYGNEMPVHHPGAAGDLEYIRGALGAVVDTRQLGTDHAIAGSDASIEVEATIAADGSLKLGKPRDPDAAPGSPNGCAGCDKGVPYEKGTEYRHTNEGPNCSHAIETEIVVTPPVNIGVLPVTRRGRKNKKKDGEESPAAVAQSAVRSPQSNESVTNSLAMADAIATKMSKTTTNGVDPNAKPLDIATCDTHGIYAGAHCPTCLRAPPRCTWDEAKTRAQSGTDPTFEEAFFGAP